MTATKVIGESVKQTNRTFIKSYVNDYADAITENYRRYHINTLKEIYMVTIQSMLGNS